MVFYGLRQRVATGSDVGLSIKMEFGTPLRLGESVPTSFSDRCIKESSEIVGEEGHRECIQVDARSLHEMKREHQKILRGKHGWAKFQVELNTAFESAVNVP